MKKNILKSTIVVLALLLVGIFKASAWAEEPGKKLDVLFVHDTHSHLNEFATVEDGESQILGGFSKIKTLINEQKEKNPDRKTIFSRFLLSNDKIKIRIDYGMRTEITLDIHPIKLDIGR